jgi:glycosyltransferase involved in cell wall biosynthesis
VKNVLMVAFHYPPAGYSSGVQRTLKFSQYLRENGWHPIVLTAHPRAYPLSRADQLPDIPPDVIVRRAAAFDSARHLAIGGFYPRFAALPDRWVTWWLGAVASGLCVLARYRPALIWATYPIATAFLVAHTLHRLSRVPWIADFRDSMTEDDYPRDRRQRASYQRVEKKTMSDADRIVFTTEGTLRMYKNRYPQIDPNRLTVIPNGYDEEAFTDAEKQRILPRHGSGGPLVLVHSGTLYPSERDPTFFFAALARLKKAGKISAETLRIVFRAPGSTDHHRRLIEFHGVGDMIALEPDVPYRDALREMLNADGLLIFQASNCNHQVPAKVYEYLRAKRPILALTDPAGDTAHLLKSLGIDTIVPLDDEEEITKGLDAFVQAIRRGHVQMPSDERVVAFSRRAHARALAKLFDETVGEVASVSQSGMGP